MLITATIQNPSKMTAIGLLGPLSPPVMAAVCQRLDDTASHKAARVKLCSVLLVIEQLEHGHDDASSLSRTPVLQFTVALD